MIVVIFRARTRNLDAEYSETAARMRELAMGEFGCLEFHSVTEGQDEIALSYWPDEASVRAWKAHPQHILAQRTGIKKWYESYSVEVAHIDRTYRIQPTVESD